MRETKNLWKYIFWCWAVLILVMVIIPRIPEFGSGENEKTSDPDYLIHFVSFFLLSVFFILWKSAGRMRTDKNLLLTYLSAGILFTVCTELLQKIIPGRSFNPVDIMFNLAGMFAGLTVPLIFSVFQRTGK